MRRRPEMQPNSNEDGYLLVGLVVVVFLLALFLTIAAPAVARSLERDKEVESEHRAQEYVRAIHNYYLKFNAFPSSLDQLLNQNNQHFLRQQYKDPLTGGDYRLIHFGEAKTEVKGFFGEPLEGFAQGSLGALAGNASGIGTGAGASTGGIGTGAGMAGGMGTPGTAGIGSATGSGIGGGGFSLGTSSLSTPGASGSGSTGVGSSGGSVSATQFQGSKGMIVGVGSNASGRGLVEWNGSENIEDWEFLYDHRTWLLKQRVSIFGGSVGQGGSGGFGSPGAATGIGTSSPQAQPPKGTSTTP